MRIINRLTKLANHLDERGHPEEADRLDNVLQYILKMIQNKPIEDKSIDIKQTEEGDEFDLFIYKGQAVGAEPASGDSTGSTCIMNEEPFGADNEADDEFSSELGDFSDLNEGPLDYGELFS